MIRLLLIGVVLLAGCTTARQREEASARIRDREAAYWKQRNSTNKSQK
jgi:outer membrane biogenesis lipoprotein LolB